MHTKLSSTYAPVSPSSLHSYLIPVCFTLHTCSSNKFWNSACLQGPMRHDFSLYLHHPPMEQTPVMTSQPADAPKLSQLAPVVYFFPTRHHKHPYQSSNCNQTLAYVNRLCSCRSLSLPPQAPHHMLPQPHTVLMQIFKHVSILHRHARAGCMREPVM
jgi:hypothetical protein